MSMMECLLQGATALALIELGTVAVRIIDRTVRR